MSDLGILVAAMAAERMRDRVYGAVTHGPEPIRPAQERPNPIRFGFRRDRRTAIQTTPARIA